MRKDIVKKILTKNKKAYPQTSYLHKVGEKTFITDGSIVIVFENNEKCLESFEYAEKSLDLVKLGYWQESIYGKFTENDEKKYIHLEEYEQRFSELHEGTITKDTIIPIRFHDIVIDAKYLKLIKSVFGNNTNNINIESNNKNLLYFMSKDYTVILLGIRIEGMYTLMKEAFEKIDEEWR